MDVVQIYPITFPDPALFPSQIPLVQNQNGYTDEKRRKRQRQIIPVIQKVKKWTS